MKFIGFIKEHNRIKEAVSLNDLIESGSQPYPDIGKVIKYLDRGILLLAWMGYVIDEKTKKPIAPDSYLTDGLWVWPAYFTYYLAMHPTMRIDPDFLVHLENRDFELKPDPGFEFEKHKLEDELSKRLNDANG